MLGFLCVLGSSVNVLPHQHTIYD